MATITANISVSSNVLSYPISINNSMTMSKAGSCHGLEETSGLNSKKIESTTAFKLFGNAEATEGGASKVYIRNTGASTTDYFYVGYGEDLDKATVQTIGRLYGGNWMLIPWDAVGATTHDIYAKSSTVEPMHIEYMAFTE
jgi:hypothetical protein|tara:strand:- start:115 stop:537 length:423 start_codon:yes stop_codon:yes gene_type:complete